MTGCNRIAISSPRSFGAALQYFTGSKAHNVVLRGMAKQRGLKINEYGVFQGERSIAGATEAAVYAALDLPCFPPELREDRQEFEVNVGEASGSEAPASGRPTRARAHPRRSRTRHLG